MAKQRFGINDGYRGSVGTVIGYMWRGKWCLRSRPRMVRNPRTAKQQSNRLLFKQMVSLAGGMKMALRKGLHVLSMEQHITECNYFIKYNKECFSLIPLSPSDSSPDPGEQQPMLAVDWENLMVSDGPLAAPMFSSPLREGGQGGAIVIPFAPCAEDERASGGDEVYLYAYCPEAGEGRLSTPAYRRNKQVSITLPETWQGHEVHLYGFAVDFKGTASPTTYIGVLVNETNDTMRNNVEQSYKNTENPFVVEPIPERPLWRTRKNLFTLRC